MSTLKVNNLQDLGADAVVTNGVVNASALPAGSILQVVSTTKTDTYSISLAGGATDTVDVTGLTATITPSSVNSKILVLTNITLGGNLRGRSSFTLRRDSSDIAIGDTGFTLRATSGFQAGASLADETQGSQSANFLDSPATTSPVTYGIRLTNNYSSTQTLRLNRMNIDVSSSAISTITLMEVAG